VKTTTVHCDVCKSSKEVEENADLQVIFTTDQTEGRSRDPYLSRQSMDLCAACRAKIVKGNYVFAHGAMGNNTYYFKED
jgi:hypothetical protein